MTTPVPTVLRFIWIILWTAHAVGAAAWWWMMPQGFPPGHWKFFANTVVPIVVFIVSMTGLGSALKPSHNFLSSLAGFPLVFWVILSAAWYQLCPISIRNVALMAAPGLLVFLMVWFWTRRARSGMTIISLIGTVIAVACGVAFAYGQRGEDATVAPYKKGVMMILPDRGALVEKPDLKRPFTLDAANAQVSVVHNGVTLHVLPLLTFISRSPDRCWSIFAPKKTTDPVRQLMGEPRETTEQLLARYTENGALILTWDENKLPVNIEALTGIEKPIYSHLNAYTIILLKGMKNPRVAFSPCADKPVEILPADYPTGRPARFAYVDADKKFHVVEARSGEKGPFKELASGAIDPAQPLTLTFMDGDATKLKVSMLDFASQVSTALSPTAGWGVPVNAIEFNRDGDGENATITVWFTLAGTSVGRGWDTVGHSPGTYRSRVKIEEP